MTLALTGVAIAVLVGAIVATSARDGRAAVIGLGVMLVLAPLVADPFGSPAGLAARLAGALLAAYPLWIVVRGGGRTGGSRLGWPAESLLAIAAYVAGYGTHGLGLGPLGPPEAQALGFGLVVVAILAVATGRDLLRIGLGLVVLVNVGVLIRTGLAGTPSDLEQLVIAAVVAGTGAAVAALAWAAASDGGGWDLAPEARPRVRRPRDARPTVRVGGPRGDLATAVARAAAAPEAEAPG